MKCVYLSLLVFGCTQNLALPNASLDGSSSANAEASSNLPTVDASSPSGDATASYTAADSATAGADASSLPTKVSDGAVSESPSTGRPYLYVPARPRVEFYALDTNAGEVSQTSEAYIELDYGYDGTPYIAVAPNGRFAYAPRGGRGGTIQALAINTATAELSKLNTVPKSEGGISLAGVVGPNSARFFYAENGSLITLPIMNDGSLGPQLAKADAGATIEDLQVFRSGTHLVAATSAEVQVYSISAPSPSKVNSQKLPGARAVREHPSGLGVLVLASDTLHWLPKTGATLGPAIASIAVTAGAKEVELTPDGRFAYVLGTSAITMLGLTETAQLTVLGEYASEYFSGTENIEIDPSGKWLFEVNNTPNITVADGRGSIVVTMRIGTDGRLTEHDLSAVYNHPANINLAVLPSPKSGS